MATQFFAYERAFRNREGTNLLQTDLNTTAAEAAAYQERLDIREARDEGLVLQVRSGESDAFYTLLYPHLRGVRALVRSFIKNPADAEDVVQNADVRAFTKLHQLRSLRFFRTWLMQIAANEARMMCRRNIRSRTLSLTDDAENENGHASLDLPDWRTIPSVEIENRQTRELRRQALEELPSKYRQVWVLRDVRELSTQEGAQALGVSINLLKTRLRRASLRLRKRLRPLRGLHPGAEFRSSVAAFLTMRDACRACASHNGNYRGACHPANRNGIPSHERSLQQLGLIGLQPLAVCRSSLLERQIIVRPRPHR